MNILTSPMVTVGQIWQWNFKIPADANCPNPLVEVINPIGKTSLVPAQVKAINNEKIYYMSWGAIVDGNWKFVRSSKFKDKCIKCTEIR